MNLNDHHLHSQKRTVQKPNSSPLKIGHPRRKVIFQPSISRCELLVSGRLKKASEKCLWDRNLSTFEVHRIESLEDKVGFGSPRKSGFVSAFCKKKAGFGPHIFFFQQGVFQHLELKEKLLEHILGTCKAMAKSSFSSRLQGDPARQ